MACMKNLVLQPLSESIISAVAQSHGEMHQGLGRCVFTACQAMPEAKHTTATDTICYFAYGANMASSTLAKREVRPLSACPARLPDHHILAFRHRGGYATVIDTSAASDAIMPWQRLWDMAPLPRGPGTSSVAPEGPNDNHLKRRGPHGVLYELLQADVHKLANLETGYALRSVAVTSYAGVETTALMFISPPLLLLPASVSPQQRYLELMLEGAQAHELAPEYRQWLFGLPSAQPGGLGAEYFDTPSEWLARCVAVSLAAAALYAAVH